MSVNPSDKGLLTPENCTVILIDHQPQMFFGVVSIDRQVLLNNLLVLAKAAKIFGVPVVLTAIECKEFKGGLLPELLELFPGETPIERSTMNSWDNGDFVAAVKKTGRRNLVIAALWTEVCLAMPALQALTDGYFVYAVEDASGGTSIVGHHAALRRMEQAGAVSVTALQVLLEFQRDWARHEHSDEVIRAVKAHCNLFGLGWEAVGTEVSQTVPLPRQNLPPQI
jgi:nicotinamidase-related amidase